MIKGVGNGIRTVASDGYGMAWSTGWYRPRSGLLEQAVAADGPLRGPPLNRDVIPPQRAEAFIDSRMACKMIKVQHNKTEARDATRERWLLAFSIRLYYNP